MSQPKSILPVFGFKKGFDENYGARPLKRVIQSELLDLLAMDLIEKKFKAGDKINFKLEAIN